MPSKTSICWKSRLAALLVFAASLALGGVLAWRSGLAGGVPPGWLLAGGGAAGFLLGALLLRQARLREQLQRALEQVSARESDIRFLNAEFKKRDAEATTELRETGERLARFATVVEATTDLVAMAKLDGSVLFVNQAGRRMVGIPPGEDCSKLNVSGFYPKWVVDRFEREGYVAAFRDGSWSAELALLHRDGREIPISFVGLILKSAEGQPQYMACIIRDISEQHRAAAELSAVNAKLSRFAAIISATSDFVAIGRLDGSVLFVNEAGRRMVGLPENADLSRTRISDFHPPDTAELIELKAIPTMLRDGAWQGEIPLLHRDGREIPVSIVGVILKSADGRPEYMGCVMRDISGQRRLEETLRSSLAREKELNRLKTNFVSMVTHEIRTPLAHILGSAEILERYLDRITPEKRAWHLQTINGGVQRLSTLMEDVLLFSRAEAGRIEFVSVEMDLGAFCAQLVEEIAQATQNRCPIELGCVDLSTPARADESLLRHIFANLLSNAVKYSPPGTPVIFSVAREEGDAVFLVRDFGIGISEDDRKGLFTPFHRGKNAVTIQGTGLGLVIVKHCVEHCGGRVEISSSENRGTTVTVRLPLFSPSHTEFLRRFQIAQETTAP